MAINRYNATLRNLEYRLRTFRDSLPLYLEDAVMAKEKEIVSAIADDQLYRRGINGRGEKIMDYAPYAPRTIVKKMRKGQPTTRVTLRDTGEFHRSMFVVFDSDGFYITSNDEKAKWLIQKYGETIFRLTNKNFTRLVRVHVRREIAKRLRQAIQR